MDSHGGDNAGWGTLLIHPPELCSFLGLLYASQFGFCAFQNMTMHEAEGLHYFRFQQ
jgi:hypothetical protein